jgi:hypothetical protein
VLLKGWHINNDEMTRDTISRSNIVINLIGSTLETRNFTFDDVHAAWPARLAAMAKEAPQVRTWECLLLSEPKAFTCITSLLSCRVLFAEPLCGSAVCKHASCWQIAFVLLQ